MPNINPATEQALPDHRAHSPDAVRRRIDAASRAAHAWRTTPIASRAVLMRNAAGVLRSRAAELARLMTSEMGKPIGQSLAEIEKCAVCCEYFAQEAPRFLATESRHTDARRSYVRYDPLGIVLAIMPWNFPFWQVIRFAAPALMAGNVGILKHASNVPGCALAIEAVLREAGLPPGAVASLLIDSAQATALIGDPLVRAITLTGSDRAGRAIAQAAGRALKKVVLELGGSDPFIVLADANAQATAQAAAGARCINSGQSCIAAKRFIVERPIAAAFTDAMVSHMQRLRVGDPMDSATQVGPLAREDLLRDLDDQVQRTLAAGGRLLCGGKRLDRKGFFYEPTVLGEVAPGMAAFDEETFGPVAAVMVAQDAQDAVRLANRSRFGLGAAIWTRDIERAEKLAGELEAGCVFINGTVKSDPRLPFGGVKDSGFGRELSEEGVREFVNIKTVWVG
jgi:succinate-semialdehyde dehydrogenase/glutarate-semialdehyde dehydrogenase